MRTAVVLAKQTHLAILGPALSNLAALLLEQFKSTGRDTRLNEALQLATWARDCLSDCDTARAPVLATLGNILASQYERSRKPQDLEEAIFSLQVATQAPSLPDDGAFPVVVSNNLACVLGKRYENTGRRTDLNDAINVALEATETGLSKYPPLMARVGSNLASLLARQYESTGDLESLASALFELRIVTEVAPKFPELNARLGQLRDLAKGQHALRAQPTAERIKVSQSRKSKLLTLFTILSLSPVLSVFYAGAFFPLIVFLAGIVSSWTLQKYNDPMTSGDRPSYLFQLVPTWIQTIFSSPYNPLRFAPTLFPTPWIDTPSVPTLTESEGEPYNGERLRRQKPIHITRVESGYDQGWKTGARNRSLHALQCGVNQLPCAPLFHPNLDFPVSSKTQCYEDGFESQKQVPYDHVANSISRDDFVDSTSDSERLVTALDSGEEEGVDQNEKTKECVPNVPKILISATGNVEKTVRVPFLNISSLG
ncbi:hypothetical protein N7509_012674 [Penicillium cosmopolitanum]|uniref:Uncharacterized protein n=1 Tax=Penicillium cosmopolitanum TaxID=1131564 RepID=A0A9W9VHE9_9EURO|nr:uncharacterized protein N7509_012674 [Penicillium cosmopolitanum]KAJ5379555.1 hypothetical protein N7509_012674 [Penicillium cosmopolitanum]